MTTWSIHEVPVPASLDAPDAWLLGGSVAAEDEALVDTWGTRDFAKPLAEVLVRLGHQEYVRRVRLAAVADAPGGSGADGADPARVLGTAVVEIPLRDNTHSAFVDVAVRPAERRRGIGSALFDAAVRITGAAGRPTLQAVTGHTAEPPPGPGALTPSTGSGRVRADDAGVRFAVARGFALEQVERYSVLDVPVDPARLAELRSSAARVAGDDYRVVTWTGRCPERWVDELARLESRMSTDAPSGGLDLTPEVWDADRVRSVEGELAERGVRYRVAAVEHVPSGTLAAFTALMCPGRTDEFVHQHDTLVRREHRGRNLGMLVKTANLEQLAVDQPAARRIGTWNAEENAHMLAINVAIGFRAAGGSGEWQRAAGSPAR